MGKLGDIEKIRDELRHHDTGIIFIIVRKREFFVFIKKFFAHVPFHM